MEINKPPTVDHSFMAQEQAPITQEKMYII